MSVKRTLYWFVRVLGIAAFLWGMYVIDSANAGEWGVGAIFIGLTLLALPSASKQLA
jgi:hypothetical protein